MKIDLQELKRLAGEATPGPWRAHGTDRPFATKAHVVAIPHKRPKTWSECPTIALTYLATEGGLPICELQGKGMLNEMTSRAEANAGLIASCHPEVIKALVDVVEKALTFDAKLIECEPRINDAFAFRQIRLGPYTGPNYGEELKAFRASLTHFTESTNEEA